MASTLIVSIIGIILSLWGIANVFFGYRFYRITLLVVFAILGASLSFILLRESPTVVQILVPGLVAFLFGLAAYYLRSVILVLAGGIPGFFSTRVNWLDPRSQRINRRQCTGILFQAVHHFPGNRHVGSQLCFFWCDADLLWKDI